MPESLPLISDPDQVRDALTHSPVPPVDRTATAGVAWLRARVPRFSTGAEHRRRRAVAIADLESLDPDALRIAARATTGRLPHVRVLADALGLVDVSIEDIELVADHYQPHTTGNPAADRAVTTLIAACGGIADERTAIRISLLLQACAATAALVAAARHDTHTTAGHACFDGAIRQTARTPTDDQQEAAVPGEFAAARICLLVQAGAATGALIDDAAHRLLTSTGADALGSPVAVRGGSTGGSGHRPDSTRIDRLLEDVLGERPPVPRTRRIIDGILTEIDLSTAPFGLGPHRCPARAHAMALAAGILEQNRPPAQ
ncbi:hypothetical protein ACFVMC_19925 [Nocardia sp. NPDC127579]|uniref:hypothetical protein n=1 Tax=Nocardia sp. NPDC127579 TaxID=3345402 RepID=UPI0036354527